MLISADAQVNEPETAAAASDDALRQAVRAKYTAVAKGETLSCCGPKDCCGSTEINMIGDAYDGLDGYVEDADLQLGCGLPVEHAGLAPGQTVLDLGAGAGLDAFVARRIVGDSGTVLGVDFTPAMVEKARANSAALRFTNVRFEHGDIEALPFADASVDVVVSNCVLNLVPNKARAFAEMLRVIRPGGHFCVSDVVSLGTLSEVVRASAELYAGCVGGAIDRGAYLDLLTAAGFEDVQVAAERPLAIPAGLLPDETEAPLFSITVRGTRPLPLSAGNIDAVVAHAGTSDSGPTLRVFDPPQCCSTGVCGPDIDPALVQFAADLKALAASGVVVERFNLAQQPEAFLTEPTVVQTINSAGVSALPMLIVDGRILTHSRYPSRDELVALLAPAAAQAAAPIVATPIAGSPSSCC